MGHHRAEATDTFASNDNTPAAADALRVGCTASRFFVSNSATAGEALIGDFAGSARVFRTGNASITIHDSAPRTSGEDTVPDYRLNQLVLRAEMRAEVAVWRPAGFRRVSEAS